MSALIIVGLDASLTGLGLAVQIPGKRIHTHVFGSATAKRVKARVARYRHLASEVVDVLREHSQTHGCRLLVAIEAYAFAASGNASHSIVEFGGVLRDRLDPLVEHWVEVNTMHLKIYATGSGKADKRDMVAGVNARWGSDFQARQHNEADAYALCRMGCELAGFIGPDVELEDRVQRVLAESAPPPPAGSAKAKAKKREAVKAAQGRVI